MEQLKQKKKKHSDLNAVLSNESKKKNFFLFRNDEVDKMEFFTRYCPDYRVEQTLKDEEEEGRSTAKRSFSTREFFARSVLENSGSENALQLNVAFQNSDVQKKRKNSGVTVSESELVFFKLEDIFARGQHDQYDLTLGELSFVSNISSENVEPKYHVFANSCANVLKQVRRSSGEILEELSTAEVPTHPIYGAMMFGSVISLQQVLEALAKAREFPHLDQLEQMFVDMLTFWLDHVLTKCPFGDGFKFFLRQAARATVVGADPAVSVAPSALLGQTLLGQGVDFSHSLPSSVPLTTQVAGGGGAADVASASEHMDIETEVDPLSNEGNPAAIMPQLNFLRLALSEFELEARRRALHCVAMGSKGLKIGELGSFVGRRVDTDCVLLSCIPMFIPGQALLDLIIDLNHDQALGIDLIEAAQRISDDSWVFQREGVWCSMVLQLAKTHGFCDFGDADEGLLPICGFAYSRLYAHQPAERRLPKDAPPNHLMCTYMAVPHERVDASATVTAAVVRGLRSSTLFFQDSVACARSEVEERLTKANLGDALGNTIFIEVRGFIRELEEKLQERNKPDGWHAQEFYLTVSVDECYGNGGEELVTSVRRALGMVGPPSAQRLDPDPVPIEWSVSGHPFLVCPSTDHDSFKSNLPPAVFQASTFSVYKVDCLKPNSTVSSVLNALFDDSKFSPHSVRRVWLSPVAFFDDKPEPLQNSSRQMCVETDGSPVVISAKTLNRICTANKSGRCMGSLQSVDTCPWLPPMQSINNLIFKNLTMGSRRSKLRYQEWDKSVSAGTKADHSTSSSPPKITVGSLVLPAKVGADSLRGDSPPRSKSYRDAAAGAGKRSSTSPPRTPSPPLYRLVGGGGGVWARGQNVGAGRGTARGSELRGAGAVIVRQSRELALSSLSTIERYRKERESESSEALARLESKFEYALARQAEIFEARLERQRAELMAVMDNKVAALAQDIKEGMDRSLGEIHSRLEGQGQAIDRVTNAVGNSAQKTEDALAELARRQTESARGQDEAARRQDEAARRQAESARRQDEAARKQEESARKQDESVRKQDEMGVLLAQLARHVMGPPSMPAHNPYPQPPSHDYHVVEGERVSGAAPAGTVEAGFSVEVAGGLPSTYGSSNLPPSAPGTVRPVRGLGGGGEGLRLAEASKRASESHGQLPPSQRVDLKKTPLLRPVGGSSGTVAFRDDGNPMKGPGVDNPGGPLHGTH